MIRKTVANEMLTAFETAFIDYTVPSNLAYKPRFVSNDYKQGRKVISSIEDELRCCEEFAMSVAFITEGGIVPLLMTLNELREKGVPGRILTTDYQRFTQPKALKKLAEMDNVEVRMLRVDKARCDFHTKGYIFRRDETYHFVIGSSNLTKNAITRNKEWNTLFVSTEDGEMSREILAEFEYLWNHEATENFDDFIDEYETQFKIEKKQREIARLQPIVNIEEYRLKPNDMQTRFVNRVVRLYNEHENKGLLISATGTGKTFASAFMLRELMDTGMKRALFVVHRETIARQARESYRKVFGNRKSLGLLSGTSKSESDRDILFSTVQMMSKEEVLYGFNKEDFDVIILDEVHRAGATSYHRIMDYFKPKFWLGMTASPDRSDGYDIYELFDHNIACEIRLQQALEEDLLCPFHYFGITDIEINGATNDDMSSFAHLVSDKRVDYVLEKANLYGYSGERVKGLIFVSRKEEARELSRLFNQRGLRTVALCGEDSQEFRMECVERLSCDNIEVHDDYLDYIFTVDIFNEGVDIPEINQVIMLRPTQSSIIFIQQLGRGLRRANNKEYVVVLDFIGNYENNYLIPIALSGDRSYNKDNVRRYVLEGESIIPGSSTIHFDEISRKRIFASIDATNFSDIRLIKENYQNLKNKLGRIPSIMDFETYGEMDITRIFDNKSLGSYYRFLEKYEPEYTVKLSKNEAEAIEFVSKKMVNGKRVYELLMMQRLLDKRYIDLFLGLSHLMKKRYGREFPEKYKENLVNVMTNEFPSGAGKKTYQNCVFIEKDEKGEYCATKALISMLSNSDFCEILRELISYGMYRYEKYYMRSYLDTDFVLYQKYTYEDACWLLGWEHNEVPLNIGGYKYDSHTKTLPVFINYDKSDDIQDTIKYEDHFVSEDTLVAISKQSRTKKSDDVQNFLYAEERGIKVELFVRKNKDDKISKEFYYLGRMKATGLAEEFVMANTDKTAVRIEWKLDVPVRDDIYRYIVNE